MILFCNLVYVYVRKIYEKYGGCTKLFMVRSESKQKDHGHDMATYGHDTDNSSMDLCLWPPNDAIFWQDISIPNLKPLNIPIRFVFKILRIFNSSEIPDSSRPYYLYLLACNCNQVITIMITLMIMT